MARQLTLATIAGGVVLFFWGFIWYAALPFHASSMQAFSNDAAVAAALKDGTDGHGIYYYPSTQAEMATKPFAFVVYDPAGSPSMGALMLKGFFGNLIATLLVSLLLLTTVDPAASFGKRIGFVVVVFLAGGALCRLPDSAWWHYPNSYIAFEIAFLLVGGALVGLVCAKLTMSAGETSSAIVVSGEASPATASA